MATNIATDLTLRDIAKRTDPNGGIADIAEVIAQKNEIWEDIPMVEANGSTYHRTTIRNGLPAGTFRAANEGVSDEKSTTIQVDDVIAELATFSEPDCKVIDMGGNTQANLVAENRAFQQGLGETMAGKVVYGDNDSNFREFHGLMPRYDSLTGAGNSENVIDGGGVGADNGSILIINWSPDTVFGVYPMGSTAGLQMDFQGKQVAYDANNKKYMAYRTAYSWDFGLVVKDWRHVVRICNIDISNLTGDKSGSSADLTDLLAEGIEQIQSYGGGAPRIYMPQKIRSFLRRQRNNTTNVQIGTDEVAGRRVMTVDDIPVRHLDAMILTEAAVS